MTGDIKFLSLVSYIPLFVRTFLGCVDRGRAAGGATPSHLPNSARLVAFARVDAANGTRKCAVREGALSWWDTREVDRWWGIAVNTRYVDETNRTSVRARLKRAVIRGRGVRGVR